MFKRVFRGIHNLYLEKTVEPFLFQSKVYERVWGMGVSYKAFVFVDPCSKILERYLSSGSNKERLYKAVCKSLPC